MKKRIVSAVALALPVVMMAQTAIDTYQMSRYDLRGTARYMSMGGAFGALGGDLSTLNNNPGGIGVYRKSEIGATLDIDIQSAKGTTPTSSINTNQTKAYCNNIGYIGSLQTGSETMPYFQWGFSYGRIASFDRHFRGSTSQMSGSLSNYIAGYTADEGWPSDDLTNSDYNYYGYNAPWMSMLAYNSFMINAPEGSTSYQGLWQNGTSGASTYDVLEKGYVDEYSINLGGNVMDIVYWGIGVGIDDIEYSQSTYYTEDLSGARIPAQRNATSLDPALNSDNVQVLDGTTTGDGGFLLNSYKRITGTGFNFKAGVIIRPTNALRIGLAVHTPTYYNLSQIAFADVDYDYGYTTGPAKASYTGTPEDAVDWKIRTPWRLMASVAGVLGNKAIISADYEYRPYQNMLAKDNDGNAYDYLTSDIKSYYKAANIVRVGAEYRLTSNLSARVGFAYESTPTGSEYLNDKFEPNPNYPLDPEVSTSNPDDTGVTPSYTMDNSATYITCGLGYHYKNFYIDAAYVHKHRESEFFAYTPNAYTNTYSSKIDQNSNNIVLSIGFKF